MMKLVSLKYNTSYQWAIQNLNLNSQINLIVAQNSTGKTRLIGLIATLGAYLKTGISKPGSSTYPDINITCQFRDEQGNQLDYHLSMRLVMYPKHEDPEPCFFEQLHFNNKLMLHRDDQQTKLYSVKSKRFVKIAPPRQQLVIHTRRDSIEYPFFEPLMEWATGIHVFEFGKIQPSKNNLYDVGRLFNALSPESKLKMVQELNEIGFPIQNISVTKGWEADDYMCFIEEKGIQLPIISSHLSQGLTRAFTLLVYLEYTIRQNRAGTFIVDDLGEGLDYERATKLGKLLVTKLENSNIQFIATTNDHFLMNVIDIKYWNILMREGSNVQSFNYENSKSAFDEFKLSGFSNFYLFSSDFLNQKL